LAAATISPGEKWLLRLNGGESELQELCRLGNAPDWRVTEDQGNYYLKSPDFDSLEDPREVRERGSELLRIIAGAAKITVDPHFEPIEVAGIARVEEGRPPTQFILPEPVIIELRVPSPTVVTSGSAPLPLLAPVIDVVAMAKEDERVATALHFWGIRHHDWHSLSKVYENIESDVGSRIWKEGWASRGEVRRFTRTAQSREAAGDEARHSLKKYTPPPNPMSVREAQTLVGRILKKWLAFKGEQDEGPTMRPAPRP
jgi:hypothetical protein